MEKIEPYIIKEIGNRQYHMFVDIDRGEFAKNAMVYFPVSHNVIQYEANGYNKRGNYLKKYQNK